MGHAQQNDETFSNLADNFLFNGDPRACYALNHCSHRELSRPYRATKLYWMMPFTFTGIPLNFVGVKRAFQAAATEASLKNGGPWHMSLAPITFPVSSISTFTTTVPANRCAFAASG